MIRWLLPILWLPMVCHGELWSFGEPVTVTDTSLAPHYHHLDGSGRRHLAAAGDYVALVWEDDRTGSPQVYVAIKKLSDPGFRSTFQLSSGTEAYEPAIASVSNAAWVVAWEQDGEILGSVLTPETQTHPLNLSSGPGRHVTLATDGTGQISAIWGKRQGHTQRLVVSDLVIRDGSLTVKDEKTITTDNSSHFQGFPAATYTSRGELFIAWEDRWAGHTRIYSSLRNRSGMFHPAAQLNEHRGPGATESYLENTGTGVMRVSLASGRHGLVEAVWLDKRNPGSGYAVWGGHSQDGGQQFSANVRVQDTMGDAVAQWHASVVAFEDILIAVWDDAREGWSDEKESGDVFLSWRSDGNWSDDLLVPGASGNGYQGSPVIAVDMNGDLHLAWIEKTTLTAPSQLRYLHGQRTY